MLYLVECVLSLLVEICAAPAFVYIHVNYYFPLFLLFNKKMKKKKRKKRGTILPSKEMYIFIYPFTFYFILFVFGVVQHFLLDKQAHNLD